MNFKNNIFFLFILISSYSFSQRDSSNYEGLIQFSGIVVSGDSVNPVPFSTIIDLNRRSGTTSDYFGYFSFVAQVGDSIRFSSVGYKTSYYHISDTLTQHKYSLIHVMQNDTILLKDVTVYPWPSKEQFAEAFVNVKLPNDDYKRAQYNLDDRNLALFADELPMSSAMTFNSTMRQYQNKVYYAGQAPPNNLLNPIAWAKFIQAWKNGDFKSKDKK